MNVSVTPITPVRERKPDEGASQKRKPTDAKVLGFVLERISQTKGGLLPSAMAPQVVIDLLPAFEAAKAGHATSSKRRSKLRKMPLTKIAPIGLRPADPEGWINALMQWILFVPGFAELFCFAPRSFQPFQEFIDQYHHDQQENRTLSSASGIPLLRFFKARWPDQTFLELCSSLIRVLHPMWEVYQTLESAIEKGCSSDLFVTQGTLKKQQLIQTDVCYDLDAFIELRPDGNTASFVAYVKVNGSWYQCDNERVTLLRSNCLAGPLYRAILLHYRRILFTKTNGWL
jgi:hypothetical protein